MTETFAGGRIMPAEQVPVDMTSETLSVSMTPVDAPDFAPRHPLCIADVSAQYKLQADRKTTVPVLFPVIGAAGEMAFEVNGKAVEPRIVRDADLFAAYSPTWRATIDAFIAGDARLSEIVRDARPEIEEQRKLWEADEDRTSFGLNTRLQGQFERRLRQLGLPDDLKWRLAHYVQDDWGRYASEGGPGGSPYTAARSRMWSEREFALAIDAQSPDPVALWTPPEAALGGFHSMLFAVAELPLRKGGNDLEVSYRQPVSFLNRVPVNVPQPHSSHYQVCQFDFILQTARFWRSFGDLECTIDLPAGTKQAQCSIPGATVTLEGEPRVTLSTSGLPSENLSVRFAGFEWSEEQPDEAETLAGAPEVTLEPVWEDVIETRSGAAFARMAPLIDGDRLIVGFADSVVVYDVNTGRSLAEFTIEGDATDAAVIGDRLLIGFQARDHHGKGMVGVAAVDLDSKTVTWSQQSQPIGHSSPPARLLKCGPTVVVWGERASVMAVDPDSGELLWELPFAARGAATDGKKLYVCGSPNDSNGDHEDSTRSRVIALDPRSGEHLWETPVGYWALGMCVDGPRLLAVATPTRADRSELVSVRASDGAVEWRREISAVSTNHVHHMMQAGPARLTIVDDRAVSNWTIEGTPRENWRIRPRYQISAFSRVHDGVICVPSADGLSSVDLASGEVHWFAPDFKARSDVYAAADGVVAVSELMGGSVVVFEPTSGTRVESAEAPSVGAAPSDLARRVLAVPAAGWPPAEYSVFTDRFTPSGGLAPDDPDYAAGAQSAEAAPGPVRMGSAATEGSGRRALTATLAVLIVGAIVWRRKSR